jgi:protoheme IX farnesyltransferase
VIGGAAGPSADDRLGGRTGHITLMPLVLFLIIFPWTPPHFWALALFVKSAITPRSASP